VRRQQNRTQLAFEALSIEGGLLSPDWLSRLAQLQAGLQSESDYRVLKGLNLRDEIGRFWRVAQAHARNFETGLARHADADALARTFVTALLREVFGFTSLAPTDALVRDGRSFPLGHVALGGKVPVVIAPADSGLDTLAPRFGEDGKRRSAFGLVQEFLNATDEALWGVACDGTTLRILRDNASLTRPAWIEADLARIFREERYADFAALWLLVHESRFGTPTSTPSECPLESWRTAGREEGTRAREHLRRGVEAALKDLGQGFLSHPDNGALRAALEKGELTLDGYFQQLLRLCYRLIFLLTAEEREVLHPPAADAATKGRYAAGYSLRRLRERSTRRSAHDRFSDLWEGQRIVLRGLARGAPKLALPALGGLFAEAQCPHLDAAKIENRFLLAGVFHLSWLREETGLSRVNWRDMGPEELGSVYESLLELVPQISNAGRTFGFATGDETRGNARKTSGSYYTPDSLVQVLLDSALDPVIKDAIAAHPENPVGALLSLSIVDPACGSGHFLLAAARRLAAQVARLEANGTPSAAQYRHALRQVVARCIYGVDLNPMALELCRVSLWMEAVEPGLPLSFLDSHLQHGNSLLGATPELLAKGIPDAAWEPIEGDDKKVASALRKRNKGRGQVQGTFSTLWSALPADDGTEVTRAVEALDRAPEDDLDAVIGKARTWEEIRASAAYRHQKFVADTWCSAFMWPKVVGPEAEAAPTNDLWHQIRDQKGTVPPSTRATVEALTAQYRFFHWHLAFPQVFRRGGFDVALGNPPWETLSPDAKEFFSTYDPQIRFQSKADQDQTIESLCKSPVIATAWERTRRELFASAQFMRDSGRFTLFASGNLGKGDFNVFRMFVEFAMRSVRPGGFAAQIVPDGIYAGANSMAIRAELFAKYSWNLLLGFENARGVWFPGIHSAAKFALYSARREVASTALRAAFLIRSEEQLRATLAGGLMRIPLSVVREFSPDALAVMEFRGQYDIDLATKMYGRWPRFGEITDQYPRRVYMREIELGHDRDLLTEDPRGVPVYEGRMVTQWDHRAKIYAAGRGRAAEWPETAFGDSRKAICPQWFVPEHKLPERTRPRVASFRMGFCDVASPTNERALVAALIPSGCIAGHSVPTFVYPAGEEWQYLIWLCAANSFAMDYLVRQKVSLHMSFAIMDTLPFPRVGIDSTWTRELVIRALRLTCTGSEMNGFWNQIASETGWVTPTPVDGAPPGEQDPVRRRTLESEVNAIVARELFDLTRSELDAILETFPIVKKNDEKVHREYRTKRLILEIYDELAVAARTGRPYLSRLDPPPADPRVAHAGSTRPARAIKESS
jgi:hypothetical protein